ncbi:hypothetical protein [Arthrobacter sp. SLBN-53]|uniref:hypothetical protein n=1 Tax=Arthrobacter sp. SLBN-53 TaxID=2768412 RepID=UPI001154A530|nr:hypothetical protein [Arthrobacter sp. SLBN-53]
MESADSALEPSVSSEPAVLTDEDAADEDAVAEDAAEEDTSSVELGTPDVTETPWEVVGAETPPESESPERPAAPADTDTAAAAQAQPATDRDHDNTSNSAVEQKQPEDGVVQPVPTVSVDQLSARTTARSDSAGQVSGPATFAPATMSMSASAAAATVTAPNPVAIITDVVHRFFDALFGPLQELMSSAPAGQNPLAWALLAFVRRTFFNQAPEITAVNIGSQQADGVITGTIDAIDPDEMGKTVKIGANVFAYPARPRTPEPDCGCAVVDGVAGLPFMNDAYLGTEPGSNWHAPDAVDITCVYIGSNGAVTYTGKEIGEVTIDGLGTGHVTLLFDGVLLSATQERSVAQLQPHLGTGDLKGVRGTVISESTLDATGAATGVLSGEVVRPELRYKLVTQAAHGTVVIDEVTGQFTYTPDPAFAAAGGDDSFEVVVTDGRFNLLNLFKPHNGDPVRTISLSVAGTTAV